MKLGKTARVSWLNICRGTLLALTLELPWPHSLGWLWEVVNWASFTMFAGGAATLMVYGLLNAWWLCEWALTDDPPYECTRDRLLREFREEEALGDRVPVGVRQDGETVYVRASALAQNRVSSTLRYLGPPPIYVPVKSGPVWVQGNPSLSHGTCLKCGAPMGRHVYYGDGPCTVDLAPGHLACLSCGCATSVVSTGGAVALCPDCGAGRRVFIPH